MSYKPHNFFSRRSTSCSIPVLDPSLYHPVSNTIDEDGIYLFDVPVPPDHHTDTLGRFAAEVGELSEITLEMFLLTIAPAYCNAKRDRAGFLSRRTVQKLRASCLEKLVEIEQLPMTDDEDGVLVGSRSLTTRHLTCPFYLQQGARNLHCITRTDLRGIKDLKQHLWLCHRQALYCPVCYDTFVLAKDWEFHARLRSCKPSGLPRPQGISVLQMQQLAQPTHPGASTDAQWLSIWQIVFPGVEPPSLTSVSDGLEVVIWALRDFWAANGHQIVSDFISQRRQQNPRLRDNEPNVTTLQTLVLDRVIDLLVTSCGLDGSDWCQSR